MTMAFARAGSAAASPPREATSETSDETLIGRIAGGDQLAMRTLYARHRIPIYRWLLRIVRDETVAEDILSEVFLDLWRKAASFESRASVSERGLGIFEVVGSSHTEERGDDHCYECCFHHHRDAQLRQFFTL